MNFKIDSSAADWSIATLRQAVQHSSLEQVLHAHAAVLDSEEAGLQAWAYVAPDFGLSQAARSADGPLAGIPFGVKDVLDVRDMPTAAGLQAYEPAYSQTDAACVAQLRLAGAVPVGKTVTAEYAFRQTGPTRNPYHPEHTPGGSSSGSAAAVAAGMVPFALSTQTGGSIIRPAAFCGVVGFKPSFGVVSRAGMRLTCDALDVIGWHSRSVADARAVAQVLLPPLAKQQPEPPQAKRFVYLDWSPAGELAPEGRAVLAQTRQTLLAAGWTQEQDMAPRWVHELMQAHDVIMHYEFARNVGPVVQAPLGRPSASLQAAVERGQRIDFIQYRDMLALRQSLSLAWSELAGSADLILTPSTPGQAPAGLGFSGSPAFCKIWSVLGWPCLHLPIGFSAQGLPVGIQLVAPLYQDHALLAWGQHLHTYIKERQYENAFPTRFATVS